MFCNKWNWNDNRGWAHGDAHWYATTAPINFPTCPNQKGYTGSGCTTRADNWNTSFGFKSQHAGGANFVLGDASVQFLTENIDMFTYQKLGDRHDGEAVGDF